MSARRRYRYRRWHGGADPLADPIDVRRVVDALGDRVLAGDGVREALRDLLRRGFTEADGAHRPGLDDLAARAARLRREALRRGRLDGALTRAGQALDQALAAERGALAGRTDDDARFAEARLDALPASTAQAVRELADYAWASPEAGRLYRGILDELRRDVLDQQFRGLRDALLGRPGEGDEPDPARSRALREMLADLNALLAAHARGEDTAEDFARFLDRHGRFFPEDPQDVEELVDALARRAEAGQRLMNALTPRQREELRDLMAQALGDDELARELAALGDHLRDLRPGLGRGAGPRGERMRGDRPLGYAEAADALQEIADLDALLDALAEADGRGGASSGLDEIDVEQVERALGRQAADEVRTLARTAAELRDQGWLSGDADHLGLSPKALRHLGRTALARVFAGIAAGRRGDHDQQDAGAAGEPTGTSRPWVFGDEQPIDVSGTLRRAVLRAAGSGALPGRAGGALPLDPSDVEVVETENRAGAAVALCVDLSYSMYADGRWAPMKQTALALATLMTTRFPQDALQIIGFGRYAETLSVAELAAVEPTAEKGTNLQHALALAQRHLRRHAAAEPVVLVVTDGEPTAHLEGGVADFWWPPTPQTVRATVAEVDALTRFGARINVFMLGEDPGLQRFMDAVARRNGGRVFTPGLDRLGEYVVSDYLRSRERRRRTSA